MGLGHSFGHSLGHSSSFGLLLLPCLVPTPRGLALPPFVPEGNKALLCSLSLTNVSTHMNMASVDYTVFMALCQAVENLVPGHLQSKQTSNNGAALDTG